MGAYASRPAEIAWARRRELKGSCCERNTRVQVLIAVMLTPVDGYETVVRACKGDTKSGLDSHPPHDLRAGASLDLERDDGCQALPWAIGRSRLGWA